MLFGLRVVRATRGDVDAIEEVIRRAWRVTYPNEAHGITMRDVEAYFRQQYTRANDLRRRRRITHPPPGVSMLIARVGRKVIGYCRISADTNRNELHALYVDPAFHRHGVGRALWDASMRHFDLSKEIAVRVVTYNTRAIQFYEAIGFVDVGRRPSSRFRFQSGNTMPIMELVYKGRSASS